MPRASDPRDLSDPVKLRLPEKQLEILRRTAADRHISVNEVIRQIIDVAIARQQKKLEQQRKDGWIDADGFLIDDRLPDSQASGAGDIYAVPILPRKINCSCNAGKTMCSYHQAMQSYTKIARFRQEAAG